MAADWHPSKGFKPLATHLLIGVLYARAARYLIKDRNIIDTGLCIIKRCGIYSEEYKNWIARENESPPIVESIEFFKEYWADLIVPVNQTAIPATKLGSGMATVDNNTLLMSYGKLLANFSTLYAATQESIKNQATSMAEM
jgi:hypothetical protein